MRDGFVQELRAGRYNLLLGAGASRDSTDSQGNHLPLGGELIAELNALVGTSQTVLADAYEIARMRQPSLVEDHFKRRFVNCIPCEWMVDLTSVVWKRIWTLNVDDVVERAYSMPGREGPLLSASYTWRNPIRDDFGVQAVHLHGRVFETGPLDLIFSITEYVDAIEKKFAWFPLFFNSWVGSPFITIGSTLFGEYDLAQATRIKQPSSSSPSLYISQSIPDEMREQLDLRNLVAVELTAASASAELVELTSESRATAYYQWQSIAAPPADVARFASQFDPLSLRESVRPIGHDFFLGFEPCWDDIVTGKAATFGWHRKLADSVIEELASGIVQKLHVAFAPRFSGKTCASFVVAKLLLEQSIPVFYFRSDRTIDIKATLRVLAGRGEAVLIYDGIADFTLDLQKLMQGAVDGGMKVVVLAFERSTRRQIVLQDISGRFLEIHDQSSGLHTETLSRVDARELIGHVVQQGRYARLQRMNESDRIRLFERRNIFDAMSELEFGQGYRDRIRPRFDALPDFESRMVVFLTSFVNSFGYSMPIFLVEATGLKVAALRGLLSTRAYSDLLVEENGRLTCRYRSVAISAIKSAFPPNSIAESLEAFMTRLAPYMNSTTRKSRNYEYRILRAVMRARGLRIVLPTYALDSLYGKLEGLFGDQAAFWEQRSIASQLARQFVPATSYAAKAVDLAPEEVRRRTTLGRLLILRSYVDVEPGGPESWDLYGQGRSELIHAATLSPRAGVVLLNRFRQTLALYREIVKGGSVLDDYEALESDLADVHRECIDDSSLRHTAEQKIVAEMYGLFLQLRLIRHGEFTAQEAQQIIDRPLPNITEDMEFDDYA
ncbi:hypothetical protein FBY28_1943 [Arthrobacter sp. SLBN-53]|nr:hypothetical protein FBY28_1943 [Arthrobacter sp. SLBN-53]